MKQFYLLLASVLMLFVGIGSAEATTGDVITDLSSLSNSKCYAIETERGKMVANAQKTDVCSSLTNGSATSGASTEETDGQWTIIKLDDTGYYLFNVGTKKFLKSNCSFGNGDITGAALFTISKAEGADGTYNFIFKSGSNTLNNDNAGNIVLDSWKIEDEGNCIKITEVSDYNAPVTFTYDYYVGDNKIYSESRTTYQNLDYPTATTQDYTESTTPTGTVQASDNGTNIKIAVTVSSSFPFKYGTEETVWNDLTWYRLKLNNKYVNYDGTDATTKLSLVNSLSAADYTNDYLAFAFIGNPYSGFRIVNYGKGDTYTLSNSNNPYDNNTGGSTYPLMKLQSGLTVGTEQGNDVIYYYIAKPSKTDAAFLIQMKAYDNTYDKMNNRNSAVAYWNGDYGEGSYFTVEQMVPGSLTSLDNIVEGQAYTITAANGRGSFIYTDNKLTSTGKSGIAADPTDKNQQFMFEKINDNYYLYSVGAGAFIDISGNYTAAVEGTPTNSVAFVASTNSDKSYPTVLSINNKHIGISPDYDPAVISFWNSTSDDGNSLCIKAVAGVTYDDRVAFEKSKLTETIANAIAETEALSKISVLFAADDVTTAKTTINAVTYSESEGYYTSWKKINAALEALYKTAEGKKFSIRNSDNTYYLTTTKTELRGTESELGKDGVFEVKYNSNKKKFYLYGTFNSVYVNKPVNESTAPTTSATATNDFYIGMLDGSADNKVYFANVKSGFNSIHYNSNYTYHTCGWEYTAGASQWTISAVTDDQYNSLDAWEALTTAIKMTESYTFGTSLGQYDQTSLDKAKAMLSAKTATADEVAAAIAAISPSSLTINMPAKYQFIRIKDSAGNYMTSSNTTDNKISFSSTEDESSIFCYTGSALIAYKTGYFASCSTSNSKTFPCNATTVATESNETLYHIHASSLSKGKYLVSFGGDTRFMYTAANAGDFSGGATAVNNTGYEFTLEEVESVPVTITDAGMGTLYSPMALTIPDGVKAYTGTLDTENSCIKLTALEGTIPANTGVIIEGEAKSYDFATTTSTTSSDDTNCITGSTPGITCVSNAYTLQKVNNELGFYKYSGTNLGGFKAYLVNNNSSSSKGYKIVKDTDPTGINGVETEGIADGKYYDLQGKIVTTPLKNQIYILNGKKVLIK